MSQHILCITLLLETTRLLLMAGLRVCLYIKIILKCMKQFISFISISLKLYFENLIIIISNEDEQFSSYTMNWCGDVLWDRGCQSNQPLKWVLYAALPKWSHLFKWQFWKTLWRRALQFTRFMQLWPTDSSGNTGCMNKMCLPAQAIWQWSGRSPILGQNSSVHLSQCLDPWLIQH